MQAASSEHLLKQEQAEEEQSRTMADLQKRAKAELASMREKLQAGKEEAQRSEQLLSDKLQQAKLDAATQRAECERLVSCFLLSGGHRSTSRVILVLLDVVSFLIPF